MDYSKIQELLSKKNMSIKDLSEKTTFSRAGLYLAIKEERITVKTLEEIALALDVPISVFFEQVDPEKEKNILELNQELEKLKNEISEYQKECEHLVLSRDFYLERLQFLNEKLISEKSLKVRFENESEKLFVKITIHEALHFLNKDLFAAKFPEVVKNLSLNPVYESEIVERFFNLFGKSSINDILNYIDLEKFENSPAFAKLLSKYEVPDIDLDRKQIIKEIKEAQSKIKNEINLK